MIENLNQESEEQKAARRQERRRLMHKEKRKQIWMRRIVLIVIVIALLGGGYLGIKRLTDTSTKSQVTGEATEKNTEESNGEDSSQEEGAKEEIPIVDTDIPQIDKEKYLNAEYGPYAKVYSEEKKAFFEGYDIAITNSAVYPSEEKVISSNAILVDADTGRVLVNKGGGERINPASMTKILTVLVAAEHVVDLDDKVMIDISITDYCYKHDCSAVGFDRDEVVTVRDLLYGTILPSGADAAIALAEYVAGDQDRFVDMMNAKLEELGLSDTAHFTNCVGIYNEDHYCTLADMAMIMKAAVENNLAKEALTAHTYTTSPTEQHPEGITISNWFLRRIEDKETNGEVVCAKTGFVKESGCCAASYELGDNGKHYICVTADAWSSWRCIYDHVALYEDYVK